MKIKIFDTRNPNCVINNTIEELFELFQNNIRIPIILVKENESYQGINSEETIGELSSINSCNAYEIFGNVLIYPPYEGLYAFDNYEVEGEFTEKAFTVSALSCVVVKRAIHLKEVLS